MIFVISSHQVGEIFDKIRDRLKGRSYWRHVVNKFYAVENSIDGEDDQVGTEISHGYCIIC